MKNCCEITQDNTKKSFGFIDLNGIPYLIANKYSRNAIKQVDRSVMRNELTVNQSQNMRAVVNINISDVYRDLKDDIVTSGNDSKYKHLLESIKYNKRQLNHQLNVVKDSIVVKVNYQLESANTRQVIRSTTEEFRITDKNILLDINDNNINDNSLITFFSTIMASTVNAFTYGMDKMIIRITGIKLYYECVRYKHMPSQRTQKVYNHPLCSMPSPYCMNEMDYYKYHQQMQNRMMILDGCCCGNPVTDVTPPAWAMFNKFYHFDNNGNDIVLHFDEINNPTCVDLIPCGVIDVNRSFYIEPGEKLIFNINIWKDDFVLVNNVYEIAKALDIPVMGLPEDDISEDSCTCNHTCNNHNMDYDQLAYMIKHTHNAMLQQNMVINQLAATVESLKDIINKNMVTDPPSVTNPPEEGNESGTDEDERKDEKPEGPPEINDTGDDIEVKHPENDSVTESNE